MCTLKEKKETLKKEWERCFEMPIEEKLNEKGLEKFWDDATTVEEAEELLTSVAIDLLIERHIGCLGEVIGSIIGDAAKVIVIAGGSDKKLCKGEEKNEGAAAKKFAVLEKEDSHVYPDRFETADEAYDFIKVICMNSTHTFDDFKVVEEV